MYYSFSWLEKIYNAAQTYSPNLNTIFRMLIHVLLTSIILTQFTASGSLLEAAQCSGVFPSISGIPMLEFYKNEKIQSLDFRLATPSGSHVC